jgi:hypothetical protein
MRRVRDFSTGRPIIREVLAKRSTDPRVTVEELEEVCGLPPGAGLNKLAAGRFKVVGDWAGRPSVSLADAARVYVEVTADLADHAAKWQAYSAYMEARDRELAEVARAAGEAARAAQAAREGFTGTPLASRSG